MTISPYLALLLLTAANEPPPVDFDTQVVPVLTRAGCNAGACHGAAIGRGGFKLSLYGGDRTSDFDAITRQLGGRRINPSRPDDSLLLLKPTAQIDHGGGYRLDEDGPGVELIARWISEGASRVKRRELRSVQIRPSRSEAQKNDTITLRAEATFSDGTKENVTSWTIFTPDDPASIKVDAEKATAKLLRGGRHVIVARYLDRVVPLLVTVPLHSPRKAANVPRLNNIDDHVAHSIVKLGLPVSPQANDAAFFRRLRLDLTGRLPNPLEIEPFINNKDPNKRKQKIAQLVNSPDFTEYWTYRLSKLLRIHTSPQDRTAAKVYHRWLKQQLASRTPYNRMARNLLTASGDTHESGPANFYRTVAGPRMQAEFFSELFMGARLRCANCHNHPLDRWTQDDYHGLAAIFAPVKQGRVIRVSGRGEVRHPRTGAAATPRVPGSHFLKEKSDGRQALATWITGPENPYFAKAIVNRIWKAMMGRGLIEPTDDLRDTNPPTHPELLDYLVRDFVEHGYQIRRTVALIAESAAYQRSARRVEGNEEDDRFYSRALTKSLPAEVMADAICHVTGVDEKYAGFSAGTRAISLFDAGVPSRTLDILGRCKAGETCETATQGGAGLSQKLHMTNGKLINAKIAAAQGRLQQMLRDKKTNGEILSDFYFRALSRPPERAEIDFWTKELTKKSGVERRQVLEDFLWSLMTCREFSTNH